MITKEFIKRKNIIHDICLLPDTNLYVFGYGSLMFPSGINGRGMNKTYSNKDLKIATLSGFKRGLSINIYKTNYYGMSYSKDGNVIGIVFNITKQDLLTLCYSEHSYPVVTNMNKAAYALADISKQCSTDGTTVAVINEHREPVYRHSESTKRYISLVWNGIRHHSDIFKQLFISTGGIVC